MNGRPLLLFLALFLSSPAVAGYGKWKMKPEMNFNLPNEVLTCLEKSNYSDEYEITGRINPFYLRADLNGDGKMDYVVFVERVRDKKDGLLVCYGSGKSEVLFAGHPVHHVAGKGAPNSGDNLARVDFWYVYKGKLGSGFEGAPPPPAPEGEVIMIGRMETWSRALYWTGKEFVTYQLGD